MSRPDVGVGAAAAVERFLGPLELAALRVRRRRMLDAARGVVLELGGGTGEHFGLYRDVERVDVVGADAILSARGDALARRAAVPLTVRASALSDLDLPDASYDTVVSVAGLCIQPALAETLTLIRSLLRPDGWLLFCEPVPGRGARRVVEQLVRAVRLPDDLARRLDRDVTAALWRAGFTITDVERFTMPTLWLPLRSFAQGAARPTRDPR